MNLKACINIPLSIWSQRTLLLWNASSSYLVSDLPLLLALQILFLPSMSVSFKNRDSVFFFFHYYTSPQCLALAINRYNRSVIVKVLSADPNFIRERRS